MRSVTALRRHALMGAGLLALVACAASDGTGNTPPVVSEDGTVIQRNLLMSDLYVGSPGQSRAKNEVFRLASVTATQTVSDAGDPADFAPDGLERYEDGRSRFGPQTTLTYTAADNGFSFVIEDGAAGTYSVALTDLLFMNPSEDALIEHAQFGKLYASNPDWFGGINLPAGSWGSYAAAYDDLDEDEKAFVDARTAQLLGYENFLYDVVTPTHVGYLSTTKGNYGGIPFEAVAIGSFELTEIATDNDVSTHFVFGHRTPVAEVPISGTATHEGRIVGSVLTNNSIRSLTGSSFLDVDFSTGQVDLRLVSSIREAGNNSGGNTFFDYRDISGSGTIDGNRFSGGLLDPDTATTGAFDGGFFGPRANEFGGTFYFGGNGGYATGAIAGAEQESSPSN